ncbi:MAG: M23 family metallopeptidase [Treponema sp.]|nr:M23 family metallopeptidase [Treponema sp.]
MKNIKKIFVVLLLLQIEALFGQAITQTTSTAKYQEEDCNIYLIYNDSLVPGDAIFVRMMIQTPKTHKKDKPFEKQATLQLYRKSKTKPIESGVFYSTGKSKKATNQEMLCGIPLSSFLEKDDYYLLITVKEGNDSVKEINLPLTFQARKFNSETIPLDSTNTAIKTDNSSARAAQIEKLNEILATVNADAVNALKPMASPTTSTRYTSWFGDRRVYAYSNGKSSTSLHYGNDYGIPEGSEVKACSDGKVVLAEWRNSTGWSIVIEHLPGLYSLYYHLSEMLVKEGDTVKTGDLIAKSGKTGLATGPHLHWEMRLNMSAVRPEFFLTNFTFEGVNYY